MDDPLLPRTQTEVRQRFSAAGVPLAPGGVLANRYELRRVLGRGAMGEVWLAFDLRLRIELALKALLTGGIDSEERLRREVRVAREVLSPNVCRVFDLIEADGCELLSMEYIDGTTLRSLLDERSPLDLREAQDIGSQFLSGLEAIHAAGLVHRDFKPANVMITRSGRVVVMDFGLAKPFQGAGSIAGTPVYMAPEQSRGESIDATADVFAAGVVLAEMINPEGVRDARQRENIWRGVRQQPISLPDTPWSAILRKATAHHRDERYLSAAAMARAIEEVSERLGLVDDISPYPGLGSFTESESEYFFGREAEIESMWRKLSGPARLLGLIGPSGAGKSSFLRAGLLAAQPEGWRIVAITPGNRPLASLARKLAPDLSGDVAAIASLADFDDPSVALRVMQRWRGPQGNALLIVDQFEELFTLNPAEVQKRFAELLSRLTTEADVHVLIALRDDFLIRCHDHERLTPLFSDLTPLKTPEGEALRRTIVQPALKCGYRFEDETLIASILSEVSGERAALPLVAFAMARLWEKRDRQNGVLTRAAYEEIGGVGGALAQHAEATLERIGHDRVPIVRELFRNLVTAQRTRASREREELLSVFADRTTAGAVLDALVSARLLTSYEPGEGERPRIEIIHESLLVAWPRLLRWQMQDAEGALLRDHLRQAAQLWAERGRAEELLWSGSAYREFSLWRSRYPGTLTAAEETFASAMVANANRRRQRARLAYALIVAAAVAVAAIMSVMWQRSERSEQQARAETRRAEAQKLLALSQVDLDEYPTAALAYATKSLEVADTREARQRVMEILWRGPIARILPHMTGAPTAVAFSPDANSAAVVSAFGANILASNGGAMRRIAGPTKVTRWSGVSFTDDARFLVYQMTDVLRVASVSGAATLRTIPNAKGLLSVSKDTVITMAPDERGALIRSWPLTGGAAADLGRADRAAWERYSKGDIRRDGSAVIFPRGATVYEQGIGSRAGTPRALWDVGQKVRFARFYENGETIVATTEIGFSLKRRDSAARSLVIENWDRTDYFDFPYLEFPRAAGRSYVVFAKRAGAFLRFHMWDLIGPPAATPLQLRWSADQTDADLHPRGDWLVTGGLRHAAFWPLTERFVRSIHHAKGVGNGRGLLFTPDSRQLLSCGGGGGFRQWSLGPPEVQQAALIGRCIAQAIDPSGSNALIGDPSGAVLLIPLAGGAKRTLIQPDSTRGLMALAASGQIAALHLTRPSDDPSKVSFYLIDLASGKMRLLQDTRRSASRTAQRSLIRDLGFAFDGSLYSAGVDGIRRWNVATGESRIVRSAQTAKLVMSGNGRYMLAVLGKGGTSRMVAGDLILFDLQRGTERRITTHGSEFNDIDIDSTGEVIATADTKSVTRVGSSSGSEPHLLVMDPAETYGLAISPDRKWVATSVVDNIRLWPMPDLSKPPLHTLPHDQLLAKLHSLTNLRAVPDKTSPSGYKIDVGPFPGWRDAPAW
jgi:eukaryotic-like serine/threonine-protein kinase